MTPPPAPPDPDRPPFAGGGEPPGEASPAPATAGQPLRRKLLLGAPLLGLGGATAAWLWRGGGVPPAEAQTRDTRSTRLHLFTVALDAAAAGTPVNRRVLGSNVQWVDNGDDMLGADFRLQPAMLALARSLSPAVLRYPGGAQSDGYHWERGMGEQADRGLNNHVNANTQQVTRMGTREFLELCEATGAEPLVTVNLITGSPEEAARWLTATNVTRLQSSVSGALLPRVAYWELGNEPYLKQESRPDLDIAPDEFARRANAFARALRAVDPTIRIGLPLTLDVRNGVPVTPYPGFARRVLGQLTEPFDFAALHDAYLPFSLDGGTDRLRHYFGAMAASRALQADFVAVRALLDELRPGVDIPLAITEYSPLFTLGQGATDNWIATPAGALYAADALRVFAATPGLLMANQWSLSGNWKFGAIHSGRYPRPVFEALRLVGEALQGELLAAPAVSADAIGTSAVGLVAAEPALPLLEATVTRELTAAGGRTLRVLLIHKDPTRSAQGRIQLDATPAGLLQSARLSLLAGNGDVFDARDVAGVMARSESTLTPVVGAGAAAVDVAMPPCSLALLTLTLTAA